jgi:hypothetical protein
MDNISSDVWTLFWVSCWLLFIGLYFLFVPNNFNFGAHVWFLVLSWYALGVFHGRSLFDQNNGIS